MKLNKKYEILEIKKSNEYLELKNKKVKSITGCFSYLAITLLFSSMGWGLPAVVAYHFYKEHDYLLTVLTALVGIIATIGITYDWHVISEIIGCVKEVNSLSNEQKQFLLEELDKRSNFIEERTVKQIKYKN